MDRYCQIMPLVLPVPRNFVSYPISHAKSIETNRGRLHNPAGAAIRYVDWGLYVVHGVRIPAEIIERPESITVKQIDEEPNSEIRRIMVDTYDRQHYAGAFLVDGNSKQINLDECGTLYLREMGEDEPIVMVHRDQFHPRTGQKL